MSVADSDRASTRAASAPDAVTAPVAGGALPEAAVPADAAVPPRFAAVATSLFGARLPLAVRYAGLLTGPAVERGLIGPREAPRIWDRHLFNCAVLADLLPSGSYVVDVGSGAGLPGIVLAVARPDLHVVLVESLARRTAFLTEAVSALGLERVDIMHARAEECAGRLPPADVVTSRAVAPLDRLARWCLPLVRPGGAVLAIKGSSAADEIATHGSVVVRHGGGEPVLRLCGAGLLDEPVRVIEVRRVAGTGEARGGRRSAGGRATGGNRATGRGSGRGPATGR